jgi:hypothetical protein
MTKRRLILLSLPCFLAITQAFAQENVQGNIEVRNAKDESSRFYMQDNRI